MWLLRISLARPQTINRNKRRSIYRSRVLVLMMNPFASNTIHAHLLSIRPPARDSRGPLDVQPNVVLFPRPNVSGRRPFRAPFLKYRTGHNYGYAVMRKVTSNIGQVARSGKPMIPSSTALDNIWRLAADPRFKDLLRKNIPVRLPFVTFIRECFQPA